MHVKGRQLLWVTTRMSPLAVDGAGGGLDGPVLRFASPDGSADRRRRGLTWSWAGALTAPGRAGRRWRRGGRRTAELPIGRRPGKWRREPAVRCRDQRRRRGDRGPCRRRGAMAALV